MKKVRIPPELGAAKAMSIDPDDIENESIESIGICYKCKKPIKDWGDGGIHHFCLQINTWSHPYCQTVLLCSTCGHILQNSVINFLFKE